MCCPQSVENESAKPWVVYKGVENHLEFLKWFGIHLAGGVAVSNVVLWKGGATGAPQPRTPGAPRGGSECIPEQPGIAWIGIFGPMQPRPGW